MSMNDPIADMLTRIRNAIMREYPEVLVPHSKVKVAIADIMQSEGFIAGYKVIDQQPGAMIQIKLKYVGDRRTQRSVITGLQRVSKSGRRVYVDAKSIPWIRSGMGSSILTTSRGVISDQTARKLGIGGEIICKIW